MDIFRTNCGISMGDVAASSRVVAFLIPVCRLLSLTLLTNSLVHRRVSHLLFAEGSPQDRRCRPPWRR